MFERRPWRTAAPRELLNYLHLNAILGPVMLNQAPPPNHGIDASTAGLNLTVRLVEQTTLPRTQDFSPEQLREAFKKVQPSTHWKDPIDAVINDADAELVDRAIAFMVYGGAEFHPMGNGKTRVTAPGYWGMESILEAQANEEQEDAPARTSPRPR